MTRKSHKTKSMSIAKAKDILRTKEKHHKKMSTNHLKKQNHDNEENSIPLETIAEGNEDIYTLVLHGIKYWNKK